MKKALLILVLIFAKTIRAQDSLRKSEFGLSAATFNSTNYSDYNLVLRPPANFMGSVFLRFYKQKIAWRVLAGYYEYQFKMKPRPNGGNGRTWESFNKDIHVGAGLQFKPIKKVKKLYCFTDMIFRSVFARGNESFGTGSFFYDVQLNTHSLKPVLD